KTQPATGETYPKSDLFNKAKQRCKHLIQSLNRSDPGFHTTECRGLHNILFNQTISAAFNQV
ncbi:TPA: hypothetical protein ACF25G_005276, partial [Klebsiella quasipneumoniae subsp. similipneumoniae]